jgi:effector-binding domain-containing protein
MTSASARPSVVTRAPQPYVGIRMTVTMKTMSDLADRIPELFAWLDAHGVAPTGAPFFRYHVIDMERDLEVEIGVPVAEPVVGDGPVSAGVLPGGRYVSVEHIGHPDTLVDATAALLAWAEEEGLTWDVVDTPRGQRWGARLEIYHADPVEEPDMSAWTTELAFRLAG